MALQTSRVDGVVHRHVRRCGQRMGILGANAILRMKSNVTHVCNLSRMVTNRLMRFRRNAVKVTLGLRSGGINIMLVNSNLVVRRKDSMGTAKEVTRVPMDRTFLNHIMGTLTGPVSNQNRVSSSRSQLVRSPTPNVVSEHSMCRPLRAKLVTVSSVVPVKHNRQRLVVKSERANGATMTASAVLGRRKRGMVYICMTVNRGTSSITRIIATLRREKTVRCAVIMTRATSSPTALRCLTPCAKTTLTRCFVCHRRRALVVCSSLSGRTRTCHRVSLLLQEPPNHRTCPKSIFCLRSHLLRETTGLNSLLNRKDVATLPVIRARSKSISTCVPAGMVSVASKRVFLSTSLFGTKVEPTVGINVSISEMKSTTRVGTVGRMTNGLGLRLTRFTRLRTFTRFTSSLSGTARGRLTENRQLHRLLGRSRSTPLTIRRRVLAVCAKAGNCLSSLRVKRMEGFLIRLHACLGAGGPRFRRVVSSAGAFARRTRALLGRTVRSRVRHFLLRRRMWEGWLL